MLDQCLCLVGAPSQCILFSRPLNRHLALQWLWRRCKSPNQRLLRCI
ncbi:hypothetical protein WZ342_2589 [Enterococcus faecalis]|nr:hypothetical protein WZ342_2589 [Enterococcus faecalis]